MSSSVVLKWTKIPNVKTVCVQGSAKMAVEEHNKVHGEGSLKYIRILEGWYAELKGPEVKYRLVIVVEDSEGHEVIYEAILIESGRMKKQVISFHPGCIDSDGKFWIKIRDVKEACVQVIAKFAVEENNIKKGTALEYVSTIEGWYLEVNSDSLLLWLHLELKDCLGRPRKYKAVVREESPYTLRIKTLKYFERI